MKYLPSSSQFYGDWDDVLSHLSRIHVLRIRAYVLSEMDFPKLFLSPGDLAFFDHQSYSSTARWFGLLGIDHSRQSNFGDSFDNVPNMTRTRILYRMISENTDIIQGILYLMCDFCFSSSFFRVTRKATLPTSFLCWAPFWNKVFCTQNPMTDPLDLYYIITYLPPFKHMAIFSIFFVKFQVILPSHRIHWTGTFIYLLISNKDQPFMKVNIQASLGAGLDNGNSTSDSLAFLHSQNSCSISHVIGLVGSGKCRILKGHTDP